MTLSVICRWLQETHNAEVVTFTADIGQGEEVESVARRRRPWVCRKSTSKTPPKTFVANYVYPMFRANTVYEGEYLLAPVSLGRSDYPAYGGNRAKPVMTAVAHWRHGSSGNDQVRFELGAYVCAGSLTFSKTRPGASWDLNSREMLMDFCEKHQIPVDSQARANKSLYSMDANLLHISYEGGGLEDPAKPADESMWRLDGGAGRCA